jgi:DNA-directed RNA polymerase specialized sigma24 family protein
MALLRHVRNEGMEDRLPMSRSVTAEPGLAQLAGHPEPPDQRPTTDTETSEPATERLEADAQLVRALAAGGFAGPGYTAFEEDVADYGITSMRAMLRSGLIFIKCAQRKIMLPRWRMTPEDREELAVDTVGRALPVFRRKALVEGGWKPEGGASLKTSFVNFLPHQFANAYRAWHRDQEGDAARYEDISELVPALDPGPERVVLQRQEILDGLAAVEPEKARAVLVLSEDGYDQEEIAEVIGEGATRRTVEGLLRRHRQKIAMREGEGR